MFLRASALLCLLPAAAAATERVLLDRIVAVVESPDAVAAPPTVVTLQDLRIDARLILVERAGAEGLATPLDDALLRSVLNQLVAEILIAREAERLQVDELEPREAQDARRRLAVRLGGESSLEALKSTLDVDEAALGARLGRRIVVDKFIRSNFSAVFEMPEADLRAMFLAGGHPFTGGQSFEEVKDAFRSWAVQRRLSDEVARWVETLRERSRVRILL